MERPSSIRGRVSHVAWLGLAAVMVSQLLLLVLERVPVQLLKEQWEAFDSPVVTSFEMTPVGKTDTRTTVRILMYKARNECHFEGLAFYWVDARGVLIGAAWSDAELTQERRAQSRSKGWHEFTLHVQTRAPLPDWRVYSAHDCGGDRQVSTELWPWTGETLTPGEHP